jgi:hypothetical protein
VDTLPGDVSANSFDSTNAVNDRFALTVAFADSAVSLYSGWLFRRFESFARNVTLSATNRLPV